MDLMDDVRFVTFSLFMWDDPGQPFVPMADLQ
jgi:hypothetical protein